MISAGISFAQANVGERVRALCVTFYLFALERRDGEEAERAASAKRSLNLTGSE